MWRRNGEILEHHSKSLHPPILYNILYYLIGFLRENEGSGRPSEILYLLTVMIKKMKNVTESVTDL